MTSEWAWSIFTVVGAILWFWSIRLTLRAYRDERLPMWANPRNAPGRAVAARAFGTGLAMFGAGMTTGAVDTGPWTAAVLAGAFFAVVFVAPYAISVAVHNSRVDRGVTAA
ncbi:MULTISPECIES: hypothetical protein [unclassified Microbacterium]|uniref:hypothetical protein n=1 Tax=unclassified Microbacterium TaxID=2609290 RepID=UPI0022714CB6|nr:MULTISPECIES: hypothetical protein [unclassified Microbacterium]MDQ1176336.1 hypothetical protein [Microbacterium sp. SORGH_AS_0421]WAC70256.1 hypothetical protein OVA17_06070 [Microbacterium sp. SL75]